MLSTASRSSRFQFTEENMADAFEPLLTSKKGLPGIGKMWRVFREVDCHRGRADFVAVAQESPAFLKGRAIRMKLAGSLVMSCLKSKRPTSIERIASQSGLNRRSVQMALDELVEAGYARWSSEGRYVKASGTQTVEGEVWAFELKLDKPRRAVFQAQQYRAFAERVVIVVPPSQIDAYSRYRTAMKRWGIGLASFDPLNHLFEMIIRPRRRAPRSEQHRAYAVFALNEAKVS